MTPTGQTREVRIIARDPGVRGANNRIVTAKVSIPREKLGPGPKGYRVQVVDYDASRRVLLESHVFDPDCDLFAKADDETLQSDPAFHAQNTYAIVMRLLSRFEFALGRRVSWGFGGHQINVVPHAFADANAYYSEDARGLFFGYFAGRDGKPVFTCLSHDVVAHETTHSLLDGLRDSYTFPSHPDQAGLHEGLSDAVALLSVFGLRETLATLLAPGVTHIGKERLTRDALKDSVFMKLAQQFGSETSRRGDDALRHAVARPPKRGALEDVRYEQCHLRGEVLSGALLNAFLTIWTARLSDWMPGSDPMIPVERVVEDGADAADHLLTMAVRALDYCPVVDVTYDDYLSALLTADCEVMASDGRYKYRTVLTKEFGRWGILPASKTVVGGIGGTTAGAWEPPEEADRLRYDCVHLRSLQRDADEVYRFISENRDTLKVFEDAYTRVQSVRPCMRVATDGFVLQETVAEYLQILNLDAAQLGALGIAKPEAMPDNTPVRLYGGGVLIFDEFGRLKYHVRSRLDNAERQGKRLAYLWKHRIRGGDGRYGLGDGTPRGQRFAVAHRRRSGIREMGGEWDD